MADEGRRESVLILEDDAGVALLERLRLERAGFRAAVAANADDARATIERGGVDLMLLDYRLEDGASGLDFYRGVRDAGHRVPSILVTGFSDERMLAEAIRAGIRDFVPKTPDYLDYLVPTVERVLAQIRMERQLDEERAKLIRERAARAETEAARALLAEADRRKDEFLATLAHEMRNPLAAISNAVRLLKGSGSEADRDWAVDVTERQVTQLTRLIDDLLDVSRIASGKIQIKRETLDAAAVAGRAADVVRPLIEERGHELSVAVAGDPLWVEADPARLEQILVNLLTNAAKYTEPGGRIALDARREGAEVVFAVSDTGVGIAAEMLPKIFDMFTQVDASVDRSRGGLGIGLTLVRSLAELHGGRISAESAGPGRGSTFRVRLPAAAAPAAGASEPAGEPRVEPAGTRVLVVDDSEDTAKGLAKLLRLAGYRVQTAHDGLSALEAVRRFHPARVLLDLGLPDLDGYQVAEEIRRAEDGTHTTLIALSGYGQERDRARSREAGFDDHLVKPVDYDALLALLARLDAEEAAGR